MSSVEFNEYINLASYKYSLHFPVMSVKVHVAISNLRKATVAAPILWV